MKSHGDQCPDQHQHLVVRELNRFIGGGLKSRKGLQFLLWIFSMILMMEIITNRITMLEIGKIIAQCNSVFSKQTSSASSPEWFIQIMTAILIKAITDILLASQKITPVCERASRIFQGCSTLHRCLTFQITSL